MKHALANFLLNVAIRLGAKRMANAPSPRHRGSDALPSAPYVEAILTAHPVWGAEEAKAVAAFLNSPAGQLFSKRIRSVAAHVAIEGANDRANTIHSAGVSAGWNECVRYIHSLSTVAARVPLDGSATGQLISRVSGVQDTRQGAVSHLNDEPPIEDESALLERLSP